MWASIGKFNKTVWVIIVATLVTRFTSFMVWPYLALILYNRFGLNEFEIGLFISIAVSAGAVFGFWVGYLSDRFGRRRIILAGLFITSLSMFTIGIADQLWIFLVGLMGGSIGRAMVENPGKALMTDMMEDRNAKDMALHMRYFALNVGAAIGPLAGVAIGSTGEQSTFFWIAGNYIIYLVAAAIIFGMERPLKRTAMSKNLTIGSVLKVLRADIAFMLFVIAMFLSNIAYGQLDATLLQYFRVMELPDLTEFYALMILVNGSMIVLFQFPLLKLLENWRPMQRATLGVALFALGFMGFALFPPEIGWLLLASMAILSIGEAILFPTLNVIVDHMAPEHIKGSYFGAAGLSVFGFSFAPMVGGALLLGVGGFGLWISMVLLSLLVSFLFWRANQIKPATAAAN